MSTEGNVQIYRGEHEKIRSLNDVRLDLSELCDRVEGLPGEGTKYVFPVRAQLTYFRLMHPHGMVQTEIIRQDDFQTQVKATVYGEDGKCLATSHGVSTAGGDGDRGFQMLPTAESRAIGRALGFAGFGCQLRIQTYDGDDFAPTMSSPSVPDGADESTALLNPKDDFPIPAATPDPINTHLKVSANEEKQVLDVRDLDEQQATEKVPQRRKKKEAASPLTSVEPPSPPVQKEITPPLPVAENKQDVAADISNPPTMEHSVYESVETFLEASRGDPLPTQFDPNYFGENLPGDIDPHAHFVNGKAQETGVTNGLLQKTIAFYLAMPGELYKRVKAPVVPTSPNYNKTLGELIEAGDAGKAVVCLCADAYRKDNPAILAGALICAKLYCRT